MQKKAGQGTFGGRFGGRNPTPETKLMHVRRHLRRPKVSSRDETHTLSAAELPLSAAKRLFLNRKPCFRGQPLAAELPPQRVRRPNLPSAAEPGFARRTEPCSVSCKLCPKTYNHAYQLLPTSTYTYICTKGSKTILKPQTNIAHNT